MSRNSMANSGVSLSVLGLPSAWYTVVSSHGVEGSGKVIASLLAVAAALAVAGQAELPVPRVGDLEIGRRPVLIGPLGLPRGDRLGMPPHHVAVGLAGLGRAGVEDHLPPESFQRLALEVV